MLEVFGKLMIQPATGWLAELREAIVAFDLSGLESMALSRGFGRD